MPEAGLDEYLVASSIQGQTPESFSVVSSQYQYQADANGGSYTGSSITINTANIANGSGFWDTKNSFLAIPMVLEMIPTTCAMGAGANENAWAACLKSAFACIHGMSIRVAGAEISPFQPFLNEYLTFKAISEWSGADELTMGPTIMFGTPDEHMAWTALRGLSNNTLTSAAMTGATTFTGKVWNQQRRDQIRHSNVYGSETTITNLTSTANFASQLKSHCAYSSTDRVTWFYTVVIPLRCMSDYFAQLPLVRAQYTEFIVQINTCSYTLTIGQGGVDTAISASTQNGTMAIWQTPVAAAAGGGCFVNSTNAGTVAVTLTIARSSNASHPLTQARLYAHIVRLSAASEDLYLKNPVKLVHWREYVFQQQANVSTTTAINFLVSNSVQKPRRLIMVATLAGGSNGTYALSQQLSPFVNGPVVPFCQRGFAGLQVYLSGQPVLMDSHNYNFQKFLAEVRPTGMVDGGSIMAVNGRINEQSWSAGFCGFHVVDLSRHEASQDDRFQPVLVSFTNSSGLTYTYGFFLEYTKVVKVNVEDGSLVA